MSQLPVFVNKALLDPCHPSSFKYVYSYFHATAAELLVLEETMWPTTYNIYSLTLLQNICEPTGY